MLNHIVLFKLKAEVTQERVEDMMRQTRISLLKIPEILAVKCGRRTDRANPWEFFYAIEVESREKLAVCEENAIYIKYLKEVIKPHTAERQVLNYEMDPGRDASLS